MGGGPEPYYAFIVGSSIYYRYVRGAGSLSSLPPAIPTSSSGGYGADASSLAAVENTPTALHGSPSSIQDVLDDAIYRAEHATDATKVPLAGGTMTGELVVPDLSVSGLAGSTAAARYVGGTVSGAPTTGAHLLGDWATDQAGKRWTCTIAGTPGTWAQEPGTGSLELTDGTHDLAGVTKVSVSGAVVGGTSAAATLTVAAGGAVVVRGAVSAPPLQTEIEAIVGYAPNVAGKVYLLQDTGTGRHYLIASDGVVFNVAPTVLPVAGATRALTAAPQGGWSWFADPRAIYDAAVGKTFFTYVTNTGDLRVASYTHATGVVSTPVTIFASRVRGRSHGGCAPPAGGRTHPGLQHLAPTTRTGT